MLISEKRHPATRLDVYFTGTLYKCSFGSESCVSQCVARLQGLAKEEPKSTKQASFLTPAIFSVWGCDAGISSGIPSNCIIQCY